MGVRIPLSTYRIASTATRDWAKRAGINPVKATKALSETTRTMLDYGNYRAMDNYSKPNASVIRGLEGLTSRLSSGDRSRRIVQASDPFRGWDAPDIKTPVYTHKGEAIEVFGRQMGEQLGMGKTYVLRPKPDSVFSKASVAKKRGAAKKAGPKGGMR